MIVECRRWPTIYLYKTQFLYSYIAHVHVSCNADQNKLFMKICTYHDRFFYIWTDNKIQNPLWRSNILKILRYWNFSKHHYCNFEAANDYAARYICCWTPPTFYRRIWCWKQIIWFSSGFRLWQRPSPSRLYLLRLSKVPTVGPP